MGVCISKPGIQIVNNSYEMCGPKPKYAAKILPSKLDSLKVVLINQNIICKPDGDYRMITAYLSLYYCLSKIWKNIRITYILLSDLTEYAENCDAWLKEQL